MFGGRDKPTDGTEYQNVKNLYIFKARHVPYQTIPTTRIFNYANGLSRDALFRRSCIFSFKYEWRILIWKSCAMTYESLIYRPNYRSKWRKARLKTCILSGHADSNLAPSTNAYPRLPVFLCTGRDFVLFWFVIQALNFNRIFACI